MSVYEQIRKAHEREGLSVSALARRFRVHRRDVRQALASALPPPRKAAPPRAGAQDRPLEAGDRGAGWKRTEKRRENSATPLGGSGSAWSKSTAPT